MRAPSPVFLPQKEDDRLNRERAEFAMNENFRQLVSAVSILEEKVEELERKLESAGA